MLITKWDANPGGEELEYLIDRAQRAAGALIGEYMSLNGSLLPGYQRFLSAHYHLTRDIQKQFFHFSTSPKMARHTGLRQFFLYIPEPDDMHFACAASDLQAMDLETLPEPLDVALWRSYFDNSGDSRPFLRIGAALALENALTGKARNDAARALQGAFMTERNTSLLRLMHRGGALHGVPLMEALGAAELDAAEIADLVMGLRQGTVLYLRILNWTLQRDELELAPAEDRIMFERHGLGEPRQRARRAAIQRVQENGGPDLSFRRRCPFMA